MDSTGIKAEGEGEWNARRHPSHRNCVSTAGQRAAPSAASGAISTSIARQANDTFAERRDHEETLEIRAIEVTSNGIGPSHGLQANHCRAVDAPMLLPRSIRSHRIRRLAASQPPLGGACIACRAMDGAYDTRKCYDAIASPQCPCRDPTPQERQALEARHARGRVLGQ